MKLIRRMFFRSDRRRARDYLAQVCEDRIAARRKLDEINRVADRALKEAMELEAEAFRTEFFGNRNLANSAFVPSNPWICPWPKPDMSFGRSSK